MCPLAEQRVTFIEEKDGLIALSAVKKVGQIPFRLADIL